MFNITAGFSEPAVIVKSHHYHFASTLQFPAVIGGLDLAVKGYSVVVNKTKGLCGFVG